METNPQPALSPDPPAPATPPPLPPPPRRPGPPGGAEGASGPERGGAPPPPALSPREIAVAFAHPGRLIEVVLGGWNRLSRNVTEGVALGRLALLLFAASLVYALPYGALAPAGGVWKVSVLYTGSLLICFPSLLVFSAYLGFRLDALQTLVLALVITSAAALFTFGFFPIIWFIDFTTARGGGGVVTPRHISSGLLALSLLMGILHLGRCFVFTKENRFYGRRYPVLVFFWIVLLVFITYRMARLLVLA